MNMISDVSRIFPRHKAELLTGGALILAGIALRFRQLNCFEFKDDQARLVLNGLCALRDLFCVTLTQPGSSGIPNPAGGTLLAGVIALFGTQPFTFALAFTLFSVLTVIGVHRAMLPVLGRERTWYCTVLTAVSPVLVWNASNLWGPGLLIFFTAMFLRGITRYVNGGRRRELVYAGLAAALAAWLFHLSAFFLFPGMIYAAVRRRPDAKILAALAGTGLVLFGPWLYGLVFQWDHTTSSLPSSLQERLTAWGWNLLSFGNGLFFREYFTFPEWPSGVPAIAVAGAALWIFLLLRGIRQRSRHTADQTALLIFYAIPLLYLLFGLRVHPHYFMVILFPATVTASLGLKRLPEKARPVLLAATGVLLLAVTLYWQDRMIAGNGHWREFGPSGNYLESIAAELDGPTVWALRITADEKARKKLDPISTMYIFDRHMQKNGAPKLLELEWNEKQQCFQHKIR